ncbi:1-phosphatidylinositol 3-phosphate 5-kinase-like [Uloborus diversus]|uniref:1-phosphatidylinositol 3-phosphate 5-kinase-like n=1 Tax=Uloborus diversus TaxID=327109 RepID=UPI0024094C04|nr:1-phosphatidylinositol 3-phosphate 5-kinase-like [Uloborus diversus]
MPFRKDWGNEPTRRSGRLSEPKESSSRKRKNSEVDESEPKAKMLLTISMDGREIDSHCWICHKQGQEQICSSCPRVFHNQCLKSTSNEFRTQQNVCPECLTDSVDGTPLPTNITKEDLQDALSFIMCKVLDLSPKDLSHWPSAHKVCTRMDVSMLVDRINKSRYTTTAEFYRDVKWIYHNCYKEFGAYANETVSAKKIVKRIKNELLDMEACYECYHKNYSVKSVDHNPFVTLCEKPHRLLWVKLKGYPYWPSKCLKVINGLAHVHFFGTHDRTIVKANTCFLMSKTNPSGKKILRSTYQKSEDEMKLYIKNYEKRHGAYQYAPAKLVFIPSDDECHVVNKRQETSFSLNVSMSSEVENENSNIEDSGDNDSQFIEIIDDVEIAEGSENNALYENCDIIDVPDEDEPEIAMNNSENGNFENQEESSGPCESTLQGVETSTALSQDGVAMYQKGFASPRYVLHMPSQGMSLQNTSTVFEPSAIGINVNLIPTTEYSSVENVQSSNISQGEIHTDLHSVSNTEPSNGPHCAENEEDLEVCYLAERPRTGMYSFTVPSVMERVARGTQAAIVSTVDAHLGRPQLGTCEIFKVKTYSLLGGKSKILMFFDGCPESLGCTILLRGGSANELKKVKQVVQFMVYVAYNWHLERSFLMDEFAFLASFLDEELELDKSEVNDSNDDDINISPNTVENVDIDKNANLNQKQPVKKTRSRCDDNRKLETESISDFSDPLHSYLQLENDVFTVETCNLKVDSLPVPNTFSKLLDDIILCCSINIKPVLPYLETEAGKKCPLRKFFPIEIYWSRHFEKESNIEMLHQIDTQIEYDDELVSIKGIVNSRNVEILPYHPFTSYKITDVLRLSIEFQSLLADFRARGGTIKHLCIHERAMKEKEKKPPEGNQNAKDYSKNVENSNTGLCWEKKVDALDPFNHQSLAVLFSSYSCASDNAPNYCVSPWVVKMEFYGSNDITLGGFLDRYCFRSTYICPSTSCITPMTEHVRKFVHGSGCVHILLHELTNSLQGAESNILMWSWCHKCRKATPVVSMSQDTWSFSFAKYLELRFYAESYKRRGTSEQCSHSLHHDYYQYFAQNKLVAIFKYTPVFIWEIVFPAFVISVSDKAITVTALIEQIKNMAMIGHTIHSNLFSVLFSLREEYAGNNSEEFVDDMINMLKLETPSFREKIEEIQLRLTSPTLESLQINTIEDIEKNKDVCNFMWKIEDQVTLLKYHIAEVVQVWNSRIQEFISARKKEQKIQSKLLQQTSRISEDEHSITKPQEPNVDDKAIHVTQKNADSCIVVKDNVQDDKSLPEAKCEYEKKCELFYNKNKLRKLSIFGRSLSFESVFDLKYTLANKKELPVKIISKSESFLSQAKKADANKTLLENEYSISSSDSSYTYGVTPGIYAGLKVSEPEDDESYVICHKESIKETTAVTVRKRHERSKSDAETLSNPNRLSLDKPDGNKPEKKERTVKSMLSQLLSSSSDNPIENPFSSSEHLLLPQNPKLPIVVYEDKPSSIIAYTLASNDYEQKLQELKLNLASNVNVSQKDSLTSSPLLKHRPNSKNLNENSMQLEPHLSSDDMFDFSVDSVDKNHLKATNNKSSNLHLEIQFTDSTTKFYCRIYYAEQFRKLRSLIFTEGEERYIRSLSLCVQWIARGGKSGSMFCKTHDDRFILKQMPRLELQSFMELAPSYFQYLNKAYLEQKPTLLAKILGIYRIGFKNTATNAATKMDLLVMENLFYNRNVSRKYDLKGSVRNRLVNTSGLQEDDIVLLDENLLKVTCDNPLYIRPHCKTVLTSAISNDTQFLAEQSVMDYSLLVGLDEEKGELVVGIIDYIRTFTWDKKVEMMIKSSGLLGGHGKMPTVVSPELYRMRFCEAMDSYFLWIPDRWTGLGSGIDG